MASLNTAARELVLKIVYYGPGLGGKTTSLQALHESAPPERRGKLVSLATPVDRTLYFDFLPLRLPPLRGLAVRLQLFTVPGQVYFNATRRLVLSGADGIVFVADSQVDRLDANLESLENLRDNLAEHGRDLAALPHIFEWNKRDLEAIVPVDELERMLNKHAAQAFPTVATRGEGIQQTLDTITALVIKAYEAQIPASASHERATSTTVAPPTVNIKGGGDAYATAEQEDEIETSAETRRFSAAEAHEVVTSSVLMQPSEGTILADLEKIERSASHPPEVEEDKESVVGEAWDTEIAPASVTGRTPTEPPDGQRPAASAMSTRSRVSVRPSPATPATAGAATAAIAGAAFSFAPLFAPGERTLIEQIEASIARADYASALGMCDAALSRLLSSIATLVSGEDAATPASDPVAPLLLGLDGRRYLAFRAVARRARQVGDVGARDVLEAYAFLLEARVAAGQWDAMRSAVGATSAPPPPRPSVGPSALPPLPRGSIAPPSSQNSVAATTEQARGSHDESTSVQSSAK